MIHFSKPPFQVVQWIAPVKQALQNKDFMCVKSAGKVFATQP